MRFVRPVGVLRRLPLFCLWSLVVFLASCRDDPASLDGKNGDPRAFNPDWTEASHGPVGPNYRIVFPQSAVNTLEIRMTAPEWAAIRADMRALFGFDFGAGGGGGGGFPARDPIYVPVDLTFNGKLWREVGFRLKGNSSLRDAWSRGRYKLPFRLDFDRFEDSVPAIRNQRFWGFEELSFSPGFKDNSLLREKVTADILRTFGVHAARTAFYRVFIDFGGGLRYCGVYTAVEVVDDTMLLDQLGEENGNIYKPTSRLQTFVASQFEKKNNLNANDFRDVQAFIAALGSPLRTADPKRWRAELEATFDPDHFLRWLAANTAMVNWDSYGVMAHNYYLYNHSRRHLVWIPWDHNEALRGNPGVSGVGSPRGAGTGLSLSMDEVRNDWPLIRFLMDDPVYAAAYRAHLKAFVQDVFTEAALDPLFEAYHTLIAPWVLGPDGERADATFLSSPSAFLASVAELKAHVRARRALVATFVP